MAAVPPSTPVPVPPHACVRGVREGAQLELRGRRTWPLCACFMPCPSRPADVLPMAQEIGLDCTGLKREVRCRRVPGADTTPSVSCASAVHSALYSAAARHCGTCFCVCGCTRGRPKNRFCRCVCKFQSQSCDASPCLPAGLPSTPNVPPNCRCTQRCRRAVCVMHVLGATGVHRALQQLPAPRAGGPGPQRYPHAGAAEARLPASRGARRSRPQVGGQLSGYGCTWC